MDTQRCKKQKKSLPLDVAIAEEDKPVDAKCQMSNIK